MFDSLVVLPARISQSHDHNSKVMGAFPGGVNAGGWLGWFSDQSAQAKAFALSPAHSVTDTHAAPLPSPPGH